MADVIDGTDKFGKKGPTEVVGEAQVTTLSDYKEEKVPHMSGPAFCAFCQHKWVAVAPVGVISGLECPSCHRTTGVFQHQLIPVQRWVCKCGCDLYRLASRGPMCMSCGETAWDWRSTPLR